MQDHAGAQCNLGVLTEAVESNTQLIEFEIDNAELNEQNTDKINSLLTQISISPIYGSILKITLS